MGIHTKLSHSSTVTVPDLKSMHHTAFIPVESQTGNIHDFSANLWCSEIL